VGNTALDRLIRDRQQAVARAVGDEYLQARLDAGLSLRALGRATGLDPTHLGRIERAERDPSLDAMVAVATALGRDVSVRLFASTGPRVRDHVQVRMIEALLEILDPRWHARLEVAVYRPVRGVIDIVLQERETSRLVAGEGHGQLRAVEHQLRWAGEKADALPSARGWPWADVVAPPPVSRLLLLRSTGATRELVRSLPHLFRTAPGPGCRRVWIADRHHGHVAGREHPVGRRLRGADARHARPAAGGARLTPAAGGAPAP
jgi:transcriptional regulator with XRE-family HTH domain